jgi:hypothetical protein
MMTRARIIFVLWFIFALLASGNALRKVQPGPSTQIFPNRPTLLQGFDAGNPLTPHMAATGDFNGDGIPELAVPIQCLNSEVCSQFGGVDVGTNAYFSGGGNPYFVTAADLNGDGRLDLVVLNTCSQSSCAVGSVAVLLGNGDGTFQAAVPIDTPTANNYSVTVADFNSDGRPDVVVANGATISLFLGNGDGSLQSPISYSASRVQAVFVVSADFNRDGKADLAFVGSSSRVSVLLGNGNGTFKSAKTYAAGGTAQVLAVGDFSGDGIVDLAVGNSKNVAILLGNGNGTFQSPITTQTATAVRTLSVGDLNHDGKLDLVFVGGTSTTVGVLIGNGKGRFNNGFRSYSLGGALTWLAFGDFNGDGQTDVMLGDDLTNNIEADLVFCEPEMVLLPGEGNGLLVGAPSSANPGATSITSADFNGDGKADLALGNQSTISLLFGRGDGTFRVPQMLSVSGVSILSIGTGDFNGDGKPDLVVSGTSNLAVLFGNGNGTFQLPIVTAIASGCTPALTIADFNSDGHLDLGYSCGDGTIGALLGNGAGAFSAAPGTSAGVFGPILTGDFNNDGIPDLAGFSISSDGFAAATVVLGQGVGTFGPPLTTELPYAYGISAAAVGDFNGDGILDLVVGHFCSTGGCGIGTTVLYGIGDGTLQLGPSGIPDFLSDSMFAVVAADFDGDGVTDYVTSYGGVIVDINGDGNYYAADGVSLAVNDFNNDGLPDVAFAGNTVSVLINVSNGPHRKAFVP